MSVLQCLTQHVAAGAPPTAPKDVAEKHTKKKAKKIPKAENHEYKSVAFTLLYDFPALHESPEGCVAL